MIGVVVWTDANFDKAVLWCEDQGDLAYYFRSEGDLDLLLQKGDMVSFVPVDHEDCRHATSLQLVVTDSHPQLAEFLKDVCAPSGGRVTQFTAQSSRQVSGQSAQVCGGGASDEETPAEQSERRSAEIVPLHSLAHAAGRRLRRKTLKSM